MAEQLRTVRRHIDNFRECSCSFTTQLSTPKFSTTQATRFACSNAINVLRVRQETQRHRAPIEEFQNKENCARRLMLDQRAGRFSRHTICADGEVPRPILYWVLCCNRLPPESA